MTNLDNINTELHKHREDVAKTAIKLGEIAHLTRGQKNSSELLEIAKDLLSLSSRLDKIEKV